MVRKVRMRKVIMTIKMMMMMKAIITIINDNISITRIIRLILVIAYLHH